jgi:hypothetical protein
MRNRLTADDVRAAMRRYYSAPEWAILFEVADATGARHTRFADAIAMSLWPSRGLSLHGLEIKVYRHDWLREKSNPAKAEPIACRCDYWWVIAPPDVVETPEVPENWGYIVVEESGALSFVKPAAKIEAQPIDRAFMASLMRSMGKADVGEIGKLVEQRVAELRAQDEERIKGEIETRSERNSEARKQLAAIEAVIGADQMRWLGSAELATAVNMVLKSGVARTYGSLADLHRQMIAQAEQIKEAMDQRGIPEREPEKKRRRLP